MLPNDKSGGRPKSEPKANVQESCSQGDPTLRALGLKEGSMSTIKDGR